MIISVKFWIVLAHFACVAPGVRNLDQRSFADSGAISRRFVPFAPTLDEFRPEGEDAALRRLGGMNRAAVRFQEMAMRVAGHAQAEQTAGAVNISSFEGLRRHPKEGRRPEQILLRQIDKTPLPAAFRATALALEAQTLRHGSL